MAKVKPDDHIWGLESNRYVCFSFRGNRTNFGWDIANSIFDLEHSRSGHNENWPKSIQVIYRLRPSIMPKTKEIQKVVANSIFDLEHSRSGHNENWPKYIQVIYRLRPSIMPETKEIQKVVQKLSCEQKSGAGCGGGGSVRTGTKTLSDPWNLAHFPQIWFANPILMATLVVPTSTTSTTTLDWRKR